MSFFLRSPQSRLASLFVALLSVMQLAGCSLEPQYKRPANHAVSSAQYLSLASLQEVDGAGARWWEKYDDPLLNDWIVRLASENLNIKASAERVVQAEEQVRIQGGALWPALGLTGGATRSFAPGFVNPDQRSYTTSAEFGGGISWQLDLFGRTRSAVKAAQYRALASATDLRALVHTLLAELVRQRALLALLSREIDIQRDIVGSRQQTLDTVSRRYRMGVNNATAVGVYTARENFTTATAQLVFLEQQLRETMLIVDVLLNQLPGTLQQVDSSFPVLPPAQIPRADSPATLLDRRPDLIGSEFRLMAANAGIGVAIADLFPDLTISANRGFRSDELGGLLTNNNAVGFLAGNITSRLFEGGRLRAQIRLTESQAKELAWQYADAVLSAMAEVETALVQERFLRQRVDQLEASANAARQAEELAQQRYQRGISTLLIVLETQRRRQNAERNLLLAQRASWLARVNLQLALGGDWLGFSDTQS